MDVRAWTGAVVGCLVAVASVGVGPVAPAGAAITVTSAGTVVTAQVTGAATVGVACTAGTIRIGGVAASPSVTCTAVTRIEVRGDDAPQTVDARGAGAAFPALGEVSLRTFGGDDVVTLGPGTTYVDSGSGADTVRGGVVGPSGSVYGGGQSGDALTVTGTVAGELFEVDHYDTGVIGVVGEIRRGASVLSVSGVGTITIDAAGGDDTIDATGVTVAGILARTVLVGGPGDDALSAGAVAATLQGDAGDNSLVGGPASDLLLTGSRLDTVRGNGATDVIRDIGSGPVGGRNVVHAGPKDAWSVEADGDVAVHARPALPDRWVTVALARTGRQVFPAGSVGSITYDLSSPGTPADRAVLDLAPSPDQTQEVQGATAQTVVDIVAPAGVTWTVAGGTVTFSGGYQAIFASGATIHVRAPSADPHLRYARRILRDVEMTVPTAGRLQTLRDQLAAGRPPADVAAALTSTDTYRGIEVDRAFVEILRRATDPAGRTYWIGRLRDGLPLRKLRANLYGSAEYVATLGGGTLTGYVAAAYQDILGRSSDPAGLAYWVDLIEDGTPKGTVAERFLNTPEAREVLIRDRFVRFQGLDPTPEELVTWSTRVASTTSDGELALLRALAAGPTYRTRTDLA